MSDLLPSTIAAFEQWRNDKPKKGSPIPLALRQQALALLPYYSRSKIALSLRISGQQVKQLNIHFHEAHPCASPRQSSLWLCKSHSCRFVICLF